jgi:peroxiredoxin
MSHASPLTAAPPFELPDQKGRVHTLAEFLEKGPLLLAFHRGTWCPNCRKRFAELAQNAAEYKRLGAQLAIVVAQQSNTVKRYVEESGLPLDILIDESRDVLKAYGVWHKLGLDAWNIARPALFFIDRDGSIRYSFVSESQGEFPSRDEIVSAIT